MQNISSMRFIELIEDHNGTLSHTKLWSNIGMLVISFAFIHHILIKELTSDMMLAYGGIVVFGRATSKYLDKETK